MGAVDLVEAADRAILAGDMHGARRALAELRARLGGAPTEKPAEPSGTRS